MIMKNIHSNLVEPFLIIGIDSVLGMEITKNLKKQNYSYIGTSRRRENLNSQIHFLDLSQNISEWEPSEKINTTLILASITSIKTCFENRELCHLVNCKNTSIISKKMVDSGSLIIFPSTNLVYDGTIPFRKPEDQPSPITEYGRLKAETEKNLLALGDSVVIIRFSKIIPNNYPLFLSWLDSLKKSNPIFPFYDMVMSPIPLTFACKVMVRIAEMRSSGIFQVSGPDDISYADAARILARKYGLDTDLIHPISYKDSGIVLEHIPEHTTMDSSRLMDELHLIPPGIISVLDSCM